MRCLPSIHGHGQQYVSGCDSYTCIPSLHLCISPCDCEDVMPPPQQPSLPLASTRMTSPPSPPQKMFRLTPSPLPPPSPPPPRPSQHMWAYATRPPRPTDWLVLRPTYPAWTDHHIAHTCCTDWVGSLPPDLLSDRIRCDLCGALPSIHGHGQQGVSGCDLYTCIPPPYPCMST